MTAPFPHHYRAGLVWDGAYPATLDAPLAHPLPGGPPPQFDGEDSWWSPEQLLLSAANLCLLSTALAMSAKRGPEIFAYESEAEGVVDKTQDGMVYTRVIIRVKLTVPTGKKSEAEALMASAKKYSILANSLKAPEDIELKVIEAASKPAKT